MNANIKKFKVLVNEYRGTQVLKGNHISYFIYFWEAKALTFVRRCYPFFDQFVCFFIRITGKFLPEYFVIKNKSGIFTIPSIPDDSTAICCDYFESQLRHWIDLPENKGIFLDIGANRGFYSVIALKKYGYEKVISFEPNPKMYSLLESNMKNNGIIDKATLYKLALGETPSSESMYVEALHAGGGRISREPRNKENDKKLEIIKYNINVERLDNIIDENTAKNISFIKIDTEGFEENVLRGGLKTLALLPKGAHLMMESYNTDFMDQLIKSLGMVLVEKIDADHLYKKI